MKAIVSLCMDKYTVINNMIYFELIWLRIECDKKKKSDKVPVPVAESQDLGDDEKQNDEPAPKQNLNSMCLFEFNLEIKNMKALFTAIFN